MVCLDKTVLMALLVLLVSQAYLDSLVKGVNKVLQVEMDRMEEMDLMDCQVNQDVMVILAKMARQVLPDSKDCLDSLVHQG